MPLHEEIYKNNVCPNVMTQGYSFHFDANKFISAMQKLSDRNPKITHIDDTVVDSVYIQDKVSNIVLEKLGTVEADFFISCIGQAAFNMKVFKEEYHSYSNELLTDKALFYPLKYTDKRKQFHPYTVAKTMKNGWRWITPTWSRIGTGYVFSSNHISVDEATNELLTDIGDMTLTPHLVDFYPRKVKKTFKINSCTLGMAAGFLEPLDAPGLAILIWSIDKLVPLLKSIKQGEPVDSMITQLNSKTSEHYDWWVSFILHQYKTSERSDSQFWIDHKNVKFDHYDKIIKNLYNVKNLAGNLHFNSVHPEITMGEFFMFYNTTSGKDINWPTVEDYSLVRKSSPANITLKHHLDFLQELHNQCI
jgi:tryptophan halogenase